MMKKMLFILAMLVFSATHVVAADKSPLELISVNEVDVKVKNSKGVDEVKRVDAAKANVTPGDTVIFTTRYSYTGDKPATGVVITNPMPEHMLFTEGTAEGKGASIEYSADNGTHYAPAGKVKIKDAKGKEISATAVDYTHIRWVFKGALNKGAKGEVSFRAKVK